MMLPSCCSKAIDQSLGFRFSYRAARLVPLLPRECCGCAMPGLNQLKHRAAPDRVDAWSEDLHSQGSEWRR